MLAFANDLWPLFWAVIGAGGMLTVLAATLLGITGRATIRQAQPAAVPVPAGPDREYRAAA